VNCLDKTIRDAKRAIAAGTKACELTNWKEAGYLDILAAAYAAAGQYADANKFAKMAVETEPSNELRFYFQLRQQSYERALNQHK